MAFFWLTMVTIPLILRLLNFRRLHCFRLWKRSFSSCCKVPDISFEDIPTFFQLCQFHWWLMQLIHFKILRKYWYLLNWEIVFFFPSMSFLSKYTLNTYWTQVFKFKNSFWYHKLFCIHFSRYESNHRNHLLCLLRTLKKQTSKQGFHFFLSFLCPDYKEFLNLQVALQILLEHNRK